jgi:hypothetical protein
MANINDYINNNFDPNDAHNAIVARNNFENMRNMIRQRVIDCNGFLDTVKRVMLAHLEWAILMNMPLNAQLLAGAVQNINRNYIMIPNIIINNAEQLIIDDFIHIVDGLTQDERKLYFIVLQNL